MEQCEQVCIEVVNVFDNLNFIEDIIKIDVIQ
jgi:hypothetical protein